MNCFNEVGFTSECTESILQTLAEGLILLDTEGTIRFCNRSLEVMTERSREEIIGRKCCSILEEQSPYETEDESPRITGDGSSRRSY